MQVTETLSQGLKREFKVVLPATELEERLNSELSTLKDRVRINGVEGLSTTKGGRGTTTVK